MKLFSFYNVEEKDIMSAVFSDTVGFVNEPVHLKVRRKYYDDPETLDSIIHEAINGEQKGYRLSYTRTIAILYSPIGYYRPGDTHTVLAFTREEEESGGMEHPIFGHHCIVTVVD